MAAQVVEKVVLQKQDACWNCEEYRFIVWQNKILTSQIDILKNSKFYKLHLIYEKVMSYIPIVNKIHKRKDY